MFVSSKFRLQRLGDLKNEGDKRGCIDLCKHRPVVPGGAVGAMAPPNFPTTLKHVGLGLRIWIHLVKKDRILST